MGLRHPPTIAPSSCPPSQPAQRVDLPGRDTPSGEAECPRAPVLTSHVNVPGSPAFPSVFRQQSTDMAVPGTLWEPCLLRPLEDGAPVTSDAFLSSGKSYFCSQLNISETLQVSRVPISC